MGSKEQEFGLELFVCSKSGSVAVVVELLPDGAQAVGAVGDFYNSYR